MIKKIIIFILKIFRIKPKKVCKIYEHDWDESEQFKQYCKRCNAVRILMRERFEIIGENPYSWHVYEDLSDVELP